MKMVLMLLLAVCMLSGCVTMVDIKPPKTELSSELRTGRGEVVLSSCTAGERIKEIQPGVTNIDPWQYMNARAADWQTRSNIPAVVTETISDGLKQAGFTVHISTPSTADTKVLKIDCKVLEALSLTGFSAWNTGVTAAEVSFVLLTGTGWVGRDAHRAGVVVDLTFQGKKPQYTQRFVVKDSSVWGLTESGGIALAFEGALEKLQQQAVTETLNAAGIIAP